MNVKTIDIIDLNGTLVKDEQGFHLAKLKVVGDAVKVIPLSGCSLGTYFYILTYLNELGFETI